MSTLLERAVAALNALTENAIEQKIAPIRTRLESVENMFIAVSQSISKIPALTDQDVAALTELRQLLTDLKELADGVSPDTTNDPDASAGDGSITLPNIEG